MESIQKLLWQVRRKQLLVCAYPSGSSEEEMEITLGHAAAALDMASSDCIKLVQRLHRKEIIERVPADEAEPIVLTPKGRRLVQRMARNEDESQVDSDVA